MLRIGLLLACGCLIAGCAAHAVYPPTVDVPAGHLPPPGKCRIWFPELPPGQQPPPGDCYELRYHVPPGVVLIRG